MLGLPKNTELNKQLPKKAIYTKFQMNTAAKERIDSDISRITIVNEVTPARINIAEGEQVKGFYVLLVSLKKKDFDGRNIITISKIIPQNLLMILQYENEVRLAVYHLKLMLTEWKNSEELAVEIKGLDLDKVWENIIVQVGQVQIDMENTLDEQLEIDEKKQKIKREIERFEKAARSERQPKKKFELVQKLKEIRKELLD